MAAERGWRGGVYLGLGANLGDPPAQLREALRRLDACPGIAVERVSRAYRSAPWGNPDQPPFLNAVAALRTTLAPEALLAQLLEVERALGRERGGARWGPRTIDLDLLLDGDRVVDLPGCQVPHPRLARRAFVLVPLLELAPAAVVPGIGAARALLERVDAGERAGVAPLAASIDPRMAAQPSSMLSAR
jgi:2-amino-4-hydroxy-6-hydroxymethyldihydropteridine diphosphokinase